ncbi:MAG: hypothetical protein JNN15_15710, partial [Blastocatellia bacterium]|nr:hypothetical protein [Blastocatellia bacterium]
MFKVFVSRLILLTVALILCACSEALSATTEDISNFARPSFKLFTDKQGLPQNTIQAITVDQRGYVWAGTQDGAAYYNGRVWKVVDMPNRTLSNFINSICAASDGSIWFGTNGGGANRLKDGKWINYNTTNSLPSDTVSSIIESKDATVWIATRKGLVKFQNENWTLYNSDSGLPSNQITALLETTSEKGKRQLWVGTFDKGLAVLEDGKWIKFDRQNGLPSNSIVCMLETSSKSGKSLIWIGTRKEETSDGGIACYDNGVWKSYNTKNGFPDDTIWSMLQTRSKTGHLSLWVGTRDGGLVVSHSVLMEEEASWLAYDAETGMPGNEARFLYPSTLKNEPSPYFWVGFAGAGLARFNQGQWVSFDTKTHLPHSQINSILESNGTFWLGTDDGLANYEDGKWITFNKNNGLPHNQINALLETISDDNKSAVWIGTRGYLARYQDGKIDIFDEKSGLPGKVIWSLAETKSRDGIRYLWAGTNKGLAQIELSEVGKKKWTVFDTSNGLPNATIGPLLKVDFKKSSSLWIGTDNGLARYHNGKWSVFNTDSGLPNNNIYSIHESRDSDGKRYLWVGTNGGGVARTELTKSLNPQSVKWTVFSDSTTPALPNNVIYQVLDDRYNRIYLMTNKGVTRLTPRNPTDNDKSEYSVYTFNTENGLPSNECDFGASIVDSRGRIWAGTVLGAGLFDPAEEIEDRLEKPFFASSMILGSN